MLPQNLVLVADKKTKDFCSTPFNVSLLEPLTTVQLKIYSETVTGVRFKPVPIVYSDSD